MSLSADLRLNSPRRSAARRPCFEVGRHKAPSPISLVTLAVLVALWFAATHFGWASPLFLPSPAEVALQFQAVARDGYAEGTLLTHLGSSLGRIGLALAIAIPSASRSAWPWASTGGCAAS